MEIIGCPDPGCTSPAEVVDRWHFYSTDGPVEHLKTRCLAGHGFTVPVRPVGLDHALEQILAAAPQVGDPATGGPPAA
jgi:hypothetical protein